MDIEIDSNFKDDDEALAMNQFSQAYDVFILCFGLDYLKS
jgi:hypothetical protein